MNKQKLRKDVTRWRAYYGRGYGWVSLPLVSVGMGSAILNYLDIKINILAVFAFLVVVTIIIGWLDRRYGFHDEELRYAGQRSPELMEIKSDIKKLLEAQK